MPVSKSELEQNGAMSKAKGKSVKRRNSEEDEDQVDSNEMLTTANVLCFTAERLFSFLSAVMADLNS